MIQRPRAEALAVAVLFALFAAAAPGPLRAAGLPLVARGASSAAPAPAPAPATAPAAAEPTPTPRADAAASSSDQVMVDGSEVGIMTPASLEEIALSATAEAARHGLEPGQMRVTLVVIDHLEAIRGVRVSIITPSVTLSSEDGDPRGPLVVQCPACAEDDLKTASIEGVLEALSRFEDRRAELEAQPAAGETGDGAAADNATPMADQSRPRRPLPPLRPLGQAGVALLTTGLVGLGTGITFVVLGERPPRLEAAQDLLRNYARPGYPLLGVGAALAISGAVMLGFERRRAHRPDAAALRLTPTPTGLAASGRF